MGNFFPLSCGVGSSLLDLALYGKLMIVRYIYRERKEREKEKDRDGVREKERESESEGGIEGERE